MLVLNKLCCSDSDTLLVLLVDGCPQNDSGSIHQIKNGADLVHSGRQQLSFFDSTQFVGKPEGVSTAFFTHFDYFCRVLIRTWELRGTRGGLNPNPRQIEHCLLRMTLCLLAIALLQFTLLETLGLCSIAK